MRNGQFYNYGTSEVFIGPIEAQNPFHMYGTKILKKMNEIKQMLRFNLMDYLKK
jgi:hypothetical protein